MTNNLADLNPATGTQVHCRFKDAASWGDNQSLRSVKQLALKSCWHRPAIGRGACGSRDVSHAVHFCKPMFQRGYTNVNTTNNAVAKPTA
jgi:hypothetical protein